MLGLGQGEQQAQARGEGEAPGPGQKGIHPQSTHGCWGLTGLARGPAWPGRSAQRRVTEEATQLGCEWETQGSNAVLGPDGPQVPQVQQVYSLLLQKTRFGPTRAT